MNPSGFHGTTFVVTTAGRELRLRRDLEILLSELDLLERYSSARKKNIVGTLPLLRYFVMLCNVLFFFLEVHCTNILLGSSTHLAPRWTVVCLPILTVVSFPQ